MRRRLTISVDPEKYAEHAKVWALWESLPDHRRATIVIDALLRGAPDSPMSRSIALEAPTPKRTLETTYEFAPIEIGEGVDAR